MAHNASVAAADALLSQVDPEILAAIRGEQDRQRHQIELIASENYTSAAVLAAQGSVLTNKYAEGYPGAPRNWLANGLKNSLGPTMPTSSPTPARRPMPPLI
jgi:hypothetical protein